MPIHRLLEDQAFEPEHCEAMGTAFEKVLAVFRLKDRADPLVDTIAKKIIELGKQGIQEPGNSANLDLVASP